MSYILDALDKAERERKRGQVPTLQTAEQNSEPHGPRSPWRWVALFAVIFNALLAGLLIYSSMRESPPNTTLPSPAASVETLPVAPSPAPVPVTVTLDPPIHRATPPVAAPAVLLMTDQELQAQARQLDMESNPPADPAPVASAPAPLATTRESADTPLEMIPLLMEMPPQFQQALPPIRVDVHVHASQAENRFVMINLRRYHEGDEVAAGLILERITKDGMVLRFRGERFRYLMKM
ncbi:MAG: general secretion pathway protein GspB [Gammaproteobacteria bacterium]|nr:general secretion pathway protein GspB [Gammaproteobacteria bacterium]